MRGLPHLLVPEPFSLGLRPFYPRNQAPQRIQLTAHRPPVEVYRSPRSLIFLAGRVHPEFGISVQGAILLAPFVGHVGSALVFAMETKSLVSFGSEYPKERGGVCGRAVVERPPVSE